MVLCSVFSVNLSTQSVIRKFVVSNWAINVLIMYSSWFLIPVFGSSTGDSWITWQGSSLMYLILGSSLDIFWSVQVVPWRTFWRIHRLAQSSVLSRCAVPFTWYIPIPCDHGFGGNVLHAHLSEHHIPAFNRVAPGMFLVDTSTVYVRAFSFSSTGANCKKLFS